jgi:hypothetical protein
MVEGVFIIQVVVLQNHSKWRALYSCSRGHHFLPEVLGLLQRFPQAIGDEGVM